MVVDELPSLSDPKSVRTNDNEVTISRVSDLDKVVVIIVLKQERSAKGPVDNASRKFNVP